jgi:organic radical activating enzyme
MMFRDIEVMLFHTCNYNCAYCGFVTGGTVGHIADMEPFRDRAYVDTVVSFFRRHSSENNKWNFLFSGGEPLLTPNLAYFSGCLIKEGNKVRYNTNLSVPIERDQEWLAANPPDAVDVLMVSLHPESLENYDIIFERRKTLKSLGYRIIARAVGHPLLLDQLDRLDREMASIGISFTPIPMFSTNYPEAYNSEQKKLLTQHIKSFGQMIQLAGGLDVSDRLCHAGSRLLALGLGKSGKGDLYRCVSTSQTGGYMGNIFSGEKIEFLTGPTRCTRPDQTCTCSFHFESNAVIGAEDGENYEQMRNGSATNIESRFLEATHKNHLKFAPTKAQASQGTEIGETILIYKAHSVLEALLGPDRRQVFELDSRQAPLLHPYKDGVAISLEPERVRIRAGEKQGGGIRFSVPIADRRRSCITFDGKVTKGNATIAVYSGSKAHFWHMIPKFRGHAIVTEAFSPEEDEVTIYVYSDEPVEFEFDNIKVIQTSATEAARYR